MSVAGEFSMLQAPPVRACHCPLSALCKTRSAPLIKASLLNIQTVTNPSSVPDARRLTAILARYRRPNDLRSTLEIAVTFVPLAALWFMAWASLHFGYWWLSLLLAIPAAGFLVRMFMI